MAQYHSENYLRYCKFTMNIENMVNQLFPKRREELLKEFHIRKTEYEQDFFEVLEELLEEKDAGYIVISPLYSSFMTQSYEYSIGVYGQDLYLSDLNKSIYKELPLIKRYITEDFAEIDKYILKHMSAERITDYQRKDMKYRYSLKYLMIGGQIWKEITGDFVEYTKITKNISVLDNIDIVYGLYMERGEHFFSGK